MILCSWLGSKHRLTDYSVNCEGQSQKTVSIQRKFWREGKVEADSNRLSPVYQTVSFPLGYTRLTIDACVVFIATYLPKSNLTSGFSETPTVWHNKTHYILGDKLLIFELENECITLKIMLLFFGLFFKGNVPCTDAVSCPQRSAPRTSPELPYKLCRTQAQWVRFTATQLFLILESESESDATHCFTPFSTRHNADLQYSALVHTHLYFSSLLYTLQFGTFPGSRCWKQLTTECKSTLRFKTTMAFDLRPFALSSHFFQELCCATENSLLILIS